MAELKMGEFGVSKYGEAILPVAYCTLQFAWTVLTAGYLQYSEGTFFFYEANWQANLVALSEIMCAAL